MLIYLKVLHPAHVIVSGKWKRCRWQPSERKITPILKALNKSSRVGQSLHRPLNRTELLMTIVWPLKNVKALLGKFIRLPRIIAAINY